MLPHLRIGNLQIDVPIIQGGMGVRISLSNLVSSVSNCGGMGVIASVGLGDPFESYFDYKRQSDEALRQEIIDTKKKTKKPLGVNIMVALTNYENL